MDKNVKCGVIRDLLPLVVDEVANPDSVELVNAHMEECEACRGYYEGMTAAIARTANPAPESDKVFLKLGRKMKMQNSIRKWLTRALAALLAFVIIVSGYNFVDRQVSYYHMDMDPDWANVQLYYEPNGTVGARIDMKDGYGWYNSVQTYYMDGIVYLMPMRPEWTFLNKGNTRGENFPLYEIYWQDGKIVEKRSDNNDYWDPEKNRWVSEVNEIVRPVYTIRWGTMENYTTLYVEGEEIPSVLEAMNESDREKPILMSGVKKPDTPQTIIGQDDVDAEADREDAGEALMSGTPENPAQGS